MTTTRDSLSVLRDMRADAVCTTHRDLCEECKAYDEAIAHVEALALSHAKLLDAILSEAEARDYNPPADTTLVADAMTVQVAFTPGQDSEGCGHG